VRRPGYRAFSRGCSACLQSDRARGYAPRTRKDPPAGASIETTSPKSEEIDGVGDGGDGLGEAAKEGTAVDSLVLRDVLSVHALASRRTARSGRRRRGVLISSG
jgi:hypothetical protein